MSVVVMSRWVPVTAPEKPAPRERVLVSDGIYVYEGGLGLDGRWYRAATGAPMLMENFLVGGPQTWYWMKLPPPPGRA